MIEKDREFDVLYKIKEDVIRIKEKQYNLEKHVRMIWYLLVAFFTEIQLLIISILMG